MKIKRALFIAGFCFIALDLIYVIVGCVVLNTPLFQKITEMEDENRTHVKLKGVISPFPGWIWITQAKVVIKDQNISLDITLKNVSGSFELPPIRQKRIEIRRLHVSEAALSIVMKNLAETAKYIADYTKAEDQDRVKLKAKVEQARRDRFTFNFQKIRIDHLNQVTSGLGEFKGELSLDGGFEVQPGVQVEVYPTQLIFHSGALPGQFTELSGRADVQFDRFEIIEAPGNAVFPYLNAKLSLDLELQSLRMLDLRMASLSGYSLGETPSKLKMRVNVAKGVLQKDSLMETEPSQMTVQSSDWVSSGFGKLQWKVDQETSSSLSTRLTDVTFKSLKDKTWSGSLRSADIDLRLYGNDMVHAAEGVGMDIKLNGLFWQIQSAKKTSKNLKYQGWVTGGGRLYGMTGVFPKAEERRLSLLQSDLRFQLKDFMLDSSFLPPTSVVGSIHLLANPVDMGVSLMQVPKIEMNLRFDLGKLGSTQSRLSLTHVEYLISPEVKWRGQAFFQLDKTQPFIDAFREREKISSLFATALRVKNLESKMDWQMTEDRSLVRINEVKSSGVWNAYGSLVNDETGLNGRIETHVLGAPIGIRIEPEKTEVKLFPSKQWYDNP